MLPHFKKLKYLYLLISIDFKSCSAVSDWGSPVSKRTQVYMVWDSMTLHSGCCVHRVSEQAVAWHLLTHHTSQHWTSVKSYSDLQCDNKHVNFDTDTHSGVKTHTIRIGTCIGCPVMGLVTSLAAILMPRAKFDTRSACVAVGMGTPPTTM